MSNMELSMPDVHTLAKRKLYSPHQVFLGSLLGGPLAATAMLRENFLTLGNATSARKTTIWGLIGTVGLLLLGSVIPASFHSATIGLGVVSPVFGRHAVEQHQLKKQAIQESGVYSFQSSWMVLLIGLLSIVVTFAAVAAIVVTLTAIGII